MSVKEEKVCDGLSVYLCVCMYAFLHTVCMCACACRCMCVRVCTCVVIAAVPGQNTRGNQWMEGAAH